MVDRTETTDVTDLKRLEYELERLRYVERVKDQEIKHLESEIEAMTETTKSRLIWQWLVPLIVSIVGTVATNWFMHS